MQKQSSVTDYETHLLLANAVQLGADVIDEIAGDDIAEGPGGEKLSKPEIVDLLSAKVNSYLMNPTGGVK